MPGYDEQRCVVCVKEIRSLNRRIDDVLATEGPLTDEQNQELSVLVLRRGEQIQELRALTNPPENADSEENFALNEQVARFWNSFGKELSVFDQQRLALLKSKVEFAAQALRQTVKKRSLLQYQRG